MARQVGPVQPHVGSDQLYGGGAAARVPTLALTMNPDPDANPLPKQAPGHDFFRCALQRAVRNIETGHYGPGDLFVTGPPVAGSYLGDKSCPAPQL